MKRSSNFGEVQIIRSCNNFQIITTKYGFVESQLVARKLYRVEGFENNSIITYRKTTFSILSISFLKNSSTSPVKRSSSSAMALTAVSTNTPHLQKQFVKFLSGSAIQALENHTMAERMDLAGIEAFFLSLMSIVLPQMTDILSLEHKWSLGP